jgi:hypothetical protein
MSQEAITRDLMKKLADDVTSSMVRTLSLAGERQQLPIGIAAGASCIGIIAAMLNSAKGGASGQEPDPDCILLAALLVARTGIGGDDPIGDAYRDLGFLNEAHASLAGVK